MQSGSQTTEPPAAKSTGALANVIGTAIALITLVLPLLVVARYTPQSPPAVVPTTHKIETPSLE